MGILVFATHNDNKVKEVENILHGRFEIQSLRSLGLMSNIEEPFGTILANAKEKARVVHEWTNKDCFSEDTGLFVDALNGEPGVHSARYSGDHNSEANIDKVLVNLINKSNRRAHFLTIICLILNNKSYIFDGRCDGIIALQRSGTQGFGYDSIFQPDGSSLTFGQMNVDEKSQFSHRRKAFDKLIAFLNS